MALTPDNGAPEGIRTCSLCLRGPAAWPERCLCDIVNLMSRQRRKDWHSVRKGACVWIFRRREGAARQTLSPGGRADPGLAAVRGLDWLGPNRRREGGFHFRQTYRDAARSAGRRSPAQGPLPRRPANAQGAITQPLFFKRAFAVRTVVKPGRGRSR